MSWVSHDLEPYVIQRYMGKRIAFVPLLLGSYAPDLATKWLVYGTGAFGVEFAASDPARFHRGFPGAGFTHSPFFGVLVAALIFAIWRNKLWALSFMIGEWAHAFTDTLDSLGVMIAFPFSTHLYSIGLNHYTADAGRLGDAAAYFSGPAFVWDAVWIVLALASWRVLSRRYFREGIAPVDPFWSWAGRRLPEVALLALYRTSFLFGVARWAAWLLWVHLVSDYAFDVTWGGPHWLRGVSNDDLNGGRTSWRLLVLALLVSTTCLLTYMRVSGHLRVSWAAVLKARLARRAGEAVDAATPAASERPESSVRPARRALGLERILSVTLEHPGIGREVPDARVTTSRPSARTPSSPPSTAVEDRG